MIRVQGNILFIQLQPDELGPKEWAEKVLKAGGSEATLLIQALHSEGHAVCPQCAEELPPEELPQHCTYFVCCKCGRPAVALTMRARNGAPAYATFTYPI